MTPAQKDRLRNTRPKAYLYTMDNTEGIRSNTPLLCLTTSPGNPFGVPGEDYSAEYPVTREKMYTEKQVRRILSGD